METRDTNSGSGGMSFIAFGALSLAMLGFILILLNGADIIQSLAAYRWPTTLGTVLESRIWYDSTPHQISVGRTSSTLSWQIHMKYQYAVNGRTYLSEQISCDSGVTRKMYVAKLFPAGSAVQVIYNRSDPASAFLDRRIGQGTYLGFTGGWAILIAYIFWCRRRLRINKGLSS